MVFNLASTDDEGNAEIDRGGCVKIFLLLLVILAGGCGVGANNPPAKPIVELVGIELAPASATIAQGTFITLTATGTYTNGQTADISSLVNWESAAPAIAAVSNGIVAGIAMGSTTVTATLYGIAASAVPVTVTSGAAT
jgi:uncharacterized protein YjdB